MPEQFDYSSAFSRNIGWVTADEQAKLRDSRVAIAGLGGVGGPHLLTLARLGVGKFNIADFDRFELQNFNRQILPLQHRR
jgi:tRNA A37 threonylcarbamoyladenosine dehydratase